MGIWRSDLCGSSRKTGNCKIELALFGWTSKIRDRKYDKAELYINEKTKGYIAD